MLQFLAQLPSVSLNSTSWVNSTIDPEQARHTWLPKELGHIDTTKFHPPFAKCVRPTTVQICLWMLNLQASTANTHCSFEAPPPNRVQAAHI